LLKKRALSLQLEKEYERIMPSLKELSRQEAEKARKLAESQGGAVSLGVRQAFELGEKSNSEYVDSVL
jgi:nucleoporin NUP82